MFYVILNTRTNVKFHKSSTNSACSKLGCSVVRNGCSAAKLHTLFFLKNGSSWPRTSEAADGGKHAYPESGLQIAENPLGGGASRD